MDKDSFPEPGLSLNTRLVQSGRSLDFQGGIAVNPPLVRASTVRFANVAEQRDMRARRSQEQLFTYGARGTPTTFALEQAVAELEGGYRARLFPTGLAAIGMTLLAYLKPGDHVLFSDSVYEPARKFAHSFLQSYGIEYSFCTAEGSDVESMLRPNTRLVYMECPGSLVYEMCDLPRIAEQVHRQGVLLAADNTWGSGYQYRPLELGADISIMAATKYLSGHSDVMMGTAVTTQAAWPALQERCDSFGMTVSPDDAWLVLRGMRSLTARLAVHERSAMQLATWLQHQPEVVTVFCPALPGDPGNALWHRDCRGTNGLLSFELQPSIGDAAAVCLVDALALFGIGASWGGYESLVTLADMRSARSVADWSGRGLVLRLSIGLEDPADLQADLARAFAAMRAELPQPTSS